MSKREDDKKTGVPAISFGGASPQALRAAASAASAGVAAGGRAAAVGGSRLLLKIGLLAFMAVMGVSAYNVGLSLNPQNRASKNGLGMMPASGGPDDVASLERRDAPPPSNSMSVVPEALDDRTPEQKAADEAAAKAAADAAAAANAADANAQPSDPNALAAGAAGAAGHLGAYKSPTSKFQAASSVASHLAGGSGLAGGVGFGFAHQLGAPSNGRSRGMTNPGRVAAASRVASTPRVNSHLRGLAGKQLARASGLSSGAAASNAETSAATAGQAFGADNAGSAIGGAGAASTGGGAIATDDGGPINGPTTNSPSNPTNGGGAPDASHQNATPWQSMLQAAMAMAAVATVLILLASSLARTFISAGTAQILAGIAAVLGMGILSIGAMVMGMGGKTQGLVLMAIGGVITAFAAMAMFGAGDEVAAAEKEKAAAAAGLVGP